MGWVLLFISKLKGAKKDQLDAEIFTSAEMAVVKLSLKETLSGLIQNLKDNKIDQQFKNLNPCLINDVVYVQGRLGKAAKENMQSLNNLPLISNKSGLASHVIKKAHFEIGHLGTAGTLSQIRERYWIPSGRRLVKGIVANCGVCKRVQDQPYAVPKMADLPSWRLESGSVFNSVGVDFAGPLQYVVK